MAPKRRHMDELMPPCKEVEFYQVNTKRSGTRIKSRTVGVSKSPRRPKRSRPLDLSAPPPPLPLPQVFPSSAGPSQGSSADVHDLPWADEGSQSMDNAFSPPQKIKKRSGKVGVAQETLCMFPSNELSPPPWAFL